MRLVAILTLSVLALSATSLHAQVPCTPNSAQITGPDVSNNVLNYQAGSAATSLTHGITNTIWLAGLSPLPTGFQVNLAPCPNICLAVIPDLSFIAPATFSLETPAFVPSSTFYPQGVTDIFGCLSESEALTVNIIGN